MHGPKIVNFAIEDDEIATRTRCHRLRTGFGKIENREPAMGEADAPAQFQDRRSRIGPAMMQRIPHLIEHPLRFGLKPARKINEASNSAHRGIVDRALPHSREIMGIRSELKVGACEGRETATLVAILPCPKQLLQSGALSREPPERLRSRKWSANHRGIREYALPRSHGWPPSFRSD